MSKARLSVGTNTPTGEPAGGPAGPYTTDEHDDEIAAALHHESPRPKAGPKAKRQAPAQPEDAGSED